jgi:FMN phosphatase YigB (HAD superfamily)
MYYSQIGQDKYYIENISRGKRNGYFVDVGAHNGIDFSNTYKLEKDYGWNGLCIEVDDDMFELLRKNRTCKLAQECVYNKSGTVLTIEVPIANPLSEGNSMITRIKDNPIHMTGFQNQFKETRNYTKISKTLNDIFIEHSVPSFIDYMSIDIEGADYDALCGLDFSKYKIGFLTIEWGGNKTEYLDKIKLLMEKNNYIVHRINKWDVEFIPNEKKIVKSFDFWDTLVARDVHHFTEIFQAMIDDYGFPSDFKHQRIQAEQRSDGTIQDIYKKLAEHYIWNDVQMLTARQKELLTELRYIIPITENLNKVSDGDIIISDNYFEPNDLMSILRFTGFTKNVEIYVTPNGKRNRTIWKTILQRYTLESHMGDNEDTDIKSANEFGIRTELTKLSNFTTAEQHFMNHSHNSFKMYGHNLRNYRLNNPFCIQIERDIWDDMFTHILPVMIQFCVFVESIANKKRLSKIRFITRDNRLVQQLFQCLFPTYNVAQFVSSRYLNKSVSTHYTEYIKTNYDNDTLLVDLNGSFKTGRDVFKSVFGHYPNVVLFVYDQTDKLFDTFYYMFKKSDGLRYTGTYEKYSQSYDGRYIGIRKNGTYVHSINEYEYPHVVHRALQTFITSIDPIKYEPPIIDISVLKEFINNTPLKCFNLTHDSTDIPFFLTNDVQWLSI